MGLLTEDIFNQDFVTCGTIFDVERVETGHTAALAGHGFGLVPMLMGNPHLPELKNAVAELPLVSDSKHRFRLDTDALLEFVIGCFKWEVQKEIRQAHPTITISSNNKHVHYVITSDYEFDDFCAKHEPIMRITLKNL